jgi:hypothetical protein
MANHIICLKRDYVLCGLILALHFTNTGMRVGMELTQIKPELKFLEWREVYGSLQLYRLNQFFYASTIL